MNEYAKDKLLRQSLSTLSTRTWFAALLASSWLAAPGCGPDEFVPGQDAAVLAPDAAPEADAAPPPAPASLLISNSTGDNIVRYAQQSGEFLGEFVPAGVIDHPDWMEMRDGYLYVAVGDAVGDSAIVRFDGQTGQFVDNFATGGGLHRPYGFAFGSDGYLYVASFLTDEILRYDSADGSFVDVFAAGDGTAGTANGPDGVVFGPDGMLYVTTQGSVAVDGMPTFPGLPSEVLRYDVGTGQGEVFAQQPTPMADSAGYVSLLGVVFGPDCAGGTCDMFTSDFANGIRRHDTNGDVQSEISTSYTGMPTANSTGSLAFADDGTLFAVGFDSADMANPGAILRWDGATGNPLPGMGENGAVLTIDGANLVRPIGIIAVPGE